jgi:hypothetical protein
MTLTTERTEPKKECPHAGVPKNCPRKWSCKYHYYTKCPFLLEEDVLRVETPSETAFGHFKKALTELGIEIPLAPTLVSMFDAVVKKAKELEKKSNG